MPNYDAIIIGTGQAGPALARRLVAAGWKVAIIERKLFGGTCVNTGCTPTKTLVASAYVAHVARRAADYGVTIGGSLNVDTQWGRTIAEDAERMHSLSGPWPLYRGKESGSERR